MSHESANASLERQLWGDGESFQLQACYRRSPVTLTQPLFNRAAFKDISITSCNWVPHDVQRQRALEIFWDSYQRRRAHWLKWCRRSRLDHGLRIGMHHGLRRRLERRRRDRLRNKLDAAVILATVYSIRRRLKRYMPRRLLWKGHTFQFAIETCHTSQ